MLGFLVISVFLTLVNLSECNMSPPLEVSIALLFEGDMALTLKQISFIGPDVNSLDGCHITSFSGRMQSSITSMPSKKRKDLSAKQEIQDIIRY